MIIILQITRADTELNKCVLHCVGKFMKSGYSNTVSGNNAMKMKEQRGQFSRDENLAAMTYGIAYF